MRLEYGHQSWAPMPDSLPSLAPAWRRCDSVLVSVGKMLEWFMPLLSQLKSGLETSSMTGLGDGGP